MNPVRAAWLLDQNVFRPPEILRKMLKGWRSYGFLVLDQEHTEPDFYH